MMDRLVKFIFFGNYFYGVCAVMLAIEASLQQHLPLNDVLFYLLTFLVTVLYYNVAYITEKPSTTANTRSLWYQSNRVSIRWQHLLLVICFIALLLVFLGKYWINLLSLSARTWTLIILFPLIATLYYGINHKAVGRVNLRHIGWLKPFIIGCSWAGLVTVFPAIYHAIEQGTNYDPGLLNVLLFIKNFMFVSLLCILFDIKDYATDYNLRLKTFVVKVGLRRTIFYIIIPLSLIGLGSFLTFAISQSFSLLKILLNTVPFILLIAVAYSLHRRRSIFYYLAIIDGLMLVKAVCGIVAMLFF